MKILYVTTIGATMMFFRPFIKQLIDQGHTVEIACSQTEGVPPCYLEWGCEVHPVSCSRSPLNKGNLMAIKQIEKLVGEKKYDIVHCHTPIAAACTRIACRKARKQGTRVFYTAHGFHFYHGAPLKNWVIFYPIEKICARWTDKLITINQEDYALAKRKMRAKEVIYVPGVGFDISKFESAQVDRKEKRSEIGVQEDAFLLVSVGELNENKNQQVIIRALAQLNEPGIHYAIAGRGEFGERLLQLAKEQGVENQLHLLGFRSDVAQLYKAADVCCFPSIREGLGMAALEGMASGLPVIAARNRGTVEYIRSGENGFLCAADDVDAFARAIRTFYVEKEVCTKMGQKARASVAKFDVHAVNALMKGIYEEK